MDTERIHILVVDDLTDMAESTAEMLTFWGYDATACDSGAAALACARLRRPAAVLLDLAMPRMDGFEFARAFRALEGCETIPLIALSGYASSGSTARAREAGIGHELLKPAAPARLRALLVAVTQLPVVALTHQVGNRRGRRRLGRRQPAPVCLVPACSC
jgi:two-component system NtrC family sensor kinase